MILDGSEQSLQASLNTLEVFGSISGLKINSDKTKVIWIGRKKMCKEKLKTNINLNWGDTEFTLLGITFSVNLGEMIEINFRKAIVKMQNELKNWKHRLLTPIGKITLIKTFMVPKLNHLFSALPTPSEKLIKEIDNLLYKFIWDNKPDKVARKVITQKLTKGGLKMVNITNHMLAIKATWIRRLLHSQTTNWITLFNTTIATISNLPLFGTYWYKYMMNKTHNPFWKDVFRAHITIQNLIPVIPENVLSMPLWYNPKISEHPLIIKQWHKQGVTFLSDFVDPDGKIKDLTQLKNEYGVKSNWLEYRGVHRSVTRFLSTLSPLNNSNQMNRPFLPNDVNIYYQSQKGAQIFYKILNHQEYISKSKSKWNREFNIHIDEPNWNQIYKICFYTVQDNELIWLQYRILHQILGTKALMYDMKITPNTRCRICDRQKETLIHLFTECPQVVEFWKQIEHWTKNKINVDLQLSSFKIIMGHLNTDNYAVAINSLLILAKKVIFMTALKKNTLSFAAYKKLFNKFFAEQELVAKLSERTEKFNKHWIRFRALVE